ncbi:MAG: DUF1552 domain-containing protein [Isosphaeraceae bacterium]|nr:DUF1552 domain-containing protein [Isosphaeraceae bacterium]
MNSQPISRRTVLRGLGTAVALPWLEAMAPVAAVAGQAPSKSPLRMAFFYVPNGVHMPAWKPEKTGTGFDLPAILQPLAKHKDNLLVISGLAQDKGRANGDGPGDHARALGSFLTGAQPFKTDGANIRLGVSVDQVAAEHVGKHTRLPSLELGIDRGPQSGNCDSGYSCVYSANISWRNETMPMSKEINPRLVFERLFGGDSDESSSTGSAAARRRKYRLSVLDYVDEDARRLAQRLGSADKRKLDEYMTAVRDIETRITRLETPTERPRSSAAAPSYPRPTGIPTDYQQHVRLMADLLALAFQGDVTRVATFMFANEGSNRSYSFIDVPEGHHDLSHHGNDDAKQAKIQKINTFHTQLFGYFLDRLASVKEGDGTILDHSMIVYGSGIGDGNRHNHDDLPVLLVGKGNGTIRSGRHIEYDQETPMNNLYLSMLERVGIAREKLGDSNGRLSNLDS